MTSEETLNLGVMYYKGTLVEKNKDKAFELFEQAEDLGNQESFRWLGMCYYRVDKEKAFKYFEKAIEFNPQDTEILRHLGNCYYHGYGTKKDYEKAFEYWLQSAELGYRDAFYDVRFSYFYAYGVKKDLNKALYWAEKTGDQYWIDRVKKEMEDSK